MSAHKFLKGIIYGAIMGGAVTLLDKDVRNQVFTEGKRWTNQVKNIVTNPQEKIEQIGNKISLVQQSFHQLTEDVQFLADKALEIKELGEKTVQTLKEKDPEEGGC